MLKNRALGGKMKSVTSMLGFVALVALAPAMFVHAQGLKPVSQSKMSVAPDEGQTLTELPDGGLILIGGERTPSTLTRISPTGSRSRLNVSLAHPRSRHTATLLPDGSVLVFGGVDLAGIPLESAELYDPASNTVSQIGSTGLLARYGHTATVLVDGRVLISGGAGAERQPELSSELYNPRTQEVEYLDAPLDQARLDAVAALLPDRSVWLWGGDASSGQLPASADRYDFIQQKFSHVTSQAVGHLTSTLLGSTPPSVVGSMPSAGAIKVALDPVLTVRLSQQMAVSSFNSRTVTLLGPSGTVAIRPVAVDGGLLLFVNLTEDLLPGAAYTLFLNGPVDRLGRALPFTAIGFTTKTLGGSISDSSDAATGYGSSANTEPGSSSPAKSTGSRSPKKVKGTHTGSTTGTLPGLNLPAWLLGAGPTTLDVSGLSPAVSALSGYDSELWIPGTDNYRGNWTTRRRGLARRHPPVNQDIYEALYGGLAINAEIVKLKPRDIAEGKLKKILAAHPRRKPTMGQTAVAGQVLRLNGEPLANVTLSIASHSVRTDRNGEFQLVGVAAGHQELVIDGASASFGPIQYGRYEYGMDVVGNQVNALPFVIWMTRLDTQHQASIPAPTSAPMVITNPDIPGLELHLPAGTVIRDAQGKVVTQVSITPIPTDQAPFPIPTVSVPTYFTIQPGGAHLESANGQPYPGAQLIYPNFSHSLPGTRIDFWNYDPVTKGWYIYGQGTVSSDGSKVVPDAGVAIYEFTGAMVSTPGNAPGSGSVGGGAAGGGPGGGPGSGSCSGPGSGSKGSLGASGGGLGSCGGGSGLPPPCVKGDPVDCSNGLFLMDKTDLAIADVIPIAVRRVYRQLDGASRAFGIGTNLSYDFYLVGDNQSYTYADLVMPHGGRVRFQEIAGGGISGWQSAVFYSQATPGPWFGAVMVMDQSDSSNYQWIMTLKDGTVYRFLPSDQTGARLAAVVAITDPNGNSIGLKRDSAGNLTTITSPNGRKLQLKYDTLNRVSQAQDDKGRIVKYTYDTCGSGVLCSVLDPLLHSENYTYDASKNLKTITDRDQNLILTNTYDPTTSRVTRQDYSDGTFATWDYTVSNGKVTQTVFTDQRGTKEKIIFNDGGYPTQVILGYGTSIAQTYTYNRDPNTNLVNSYTDAAPTPRTTSYIYDALGNVTQITRLSGTSAATSTNIVYDPTTNRPSQISDAFGHIVKLAYNSAGALIQVTDALTHITKFGRDLQGRIQSVTNDSLITVASFGYSGADMVSATNALSNTSFLGYDSVGRLTGVTDPLGAQTVIGYDDLDRTKTVTDPNGSLVQFDYDNTNEILTTTDARTNGTTYAYYATGKVKTRKDGLGLLDYYYYEPGGKIQQHTDRKGQVTHWDYDALGRIKQVGFGATVANPTAYTSTIQYGWDSANRLTSITDSVSGGITRQYDALYNRLTQEITPQATVNYAYDDVNHTATVTVGKQPGVVYTYDVAGRLRQVQQAAGAINNNTAQTIKIDYDNLNRRSVLTLANGITVTYGFNDANQLKSLSYAKADKTAIGTLLYGYDAAGHRTSVDGTLANVPLPATVSTAVYNANNALTTWNGTSYAYDNNGNLTGDGSRIYTWNARDQLSSLTGTPAASFQYDGVGRRLSKTIGGTTTGYVYQGANYVEELAGTSSTSTVNAMLLTGGVDETFARMTGSAVTTLLGDALGSTITETNGSQTTTATLSYQPYGAVTGTGTSMQQYTGRENDGTGLYYYRARYYSPATARFVSEDPIGWASGQANNYAYVGGDPIAGADPMGLFNPAKGAVAAGNAVMAGASAASGALKLAIAAGLEPATLTGVGALPSIVLTAWGTWNLKSSWAAWERARQEWAEALCEDSSQASWKNVYGFFPEGTNFDDPGEYSGPLDYIEHQGWYEFIAQSGYL